MVLLINPKTTKPTETKTEFFREPNTGLLYLAAILEENNINVEILDLEQYSNLSRNSIDHIIKEITSFHNIIGITSLTNTFKYVKYIAKTIRNSYPTKIIVFGGPHVSFLYKEILTQDYENEQLIDFICIGEGEYNFLELVKLLNSHSVKHGNIEKLEKKINNIPNVSYINSKKKVKFTGDQKESIKINRLPLPARYKLSPVNYYYTVANIIVNRGCPNQCSFCSRQKLFETTRLRTHHSIAEEIRDIISSQTYEFVNFYDNINLNLEFFERFCKMLQSSDLHISWGCELRVDNLFLSHAKLLKDAGCKVIATGIESASRKILRKNFKYQDPQQVKKGIENLKKFKIPVQAYFVLGLPGETEKTFQNTIDYIKDLPLSAEDTINYFVATPYPGSKLWTERERFGINIIEEDFSKYDCEHIIFETDDLSYFQLEDMLKEAKNIESYFEDLH